MSKKIAVLLLGLGCSLAFAGGYDKRCGMRCNIEYRNCQPSPSESIPDSTPSEECQARYAECKESCYF